jgi:DNA-binding NarL/FixJ family response regulator
LLAAIRTVAAGEALLSPAITKRVIKQFVRSPRTTPPKEFDELTTREQEVFRLIANGLSNTEIAEELYISVKSVERHRQHILGKLGMSDRVELTRYAIRRGLIQA